MRKSGHGPKVFMGRARSETRSQERGGGGELEIAAAVWKGSTYRAYNREKHAMAGVVEKGIKIIGKERRSPTPKPRCEE